MGRAGSHPAWGVLRTAGGAHPALPAAGLADGRCAGPGRRADLRQPGGRGRVAVDGQCRRADGLGERADRSAWLDQLSAGRAVVAVCRDGVLPVIPTGLPGAAQGWALAALAAGLIVAGPLYRLASQGEAGAYLYGYAACFDAIAMGCCAAVLARRGRFAVLGRPAVRAIIGAAMAGLYLAWPIGQSNVLGTTAMAFGTALLLLGGPRRQGRMPGLARAGRLWSAQLRDLPVPSGGAGPDPGLGAAGAGVGRRAGRVAGGLSGGVLRGRLAGGAVVVGAGQRRAASAH